MATDDAPVPAPAGKRRSRFARAVLALFIALAVLALGIAVWLPSQWALDFAIARVERASGGKLRVSGATGALTSTVRAKELRWDGPEATVVARGVALDWSPLSPFSRRVVIRGLGAQSLSLEMHGGNERTALPTSLVLPLDVTIEHIGVGTLDWALGDRRGRVTGVEFAYTGGADEHHVRDFALVLEHGRITGEVSVAASAPFATQARVAFRGTGELAQATADAHLAGPLARIVVDANGRVGEARFTARAEATPFEPEPVASLTLDARAVDLAVLDPRLPATMLGVVVEVRPIDGGFAGTLDATNANSGVIDAGRVPLDALTAKFTQRGEQLVLDNVVAAFPGGGRARGRGTVDFAAGAPMTWSLGVDNLDLRQLHSQLATTRLDGTLAADLDARRQRITGDVADRNRGLGLAFAANVAERRVEITRARLAARNGALEGSGRIALDGAQPFAFTAEARRFDPSRFGDFPSGSLDGSVRAAGILAPAWRIEAEVRIAPGSKLAGLAAAGGAKATVTVTTVSAAVLEVRLGATKFSARGGVGNTGDKIEFALDARNLAELAPLVRARIPHPLAGALRMSGTLIADPGGAGGKASLHGDNLKVGTLASVGSVDARLELAPGGGGGKPVAFAARSVSADVSATKVTVAATQLTTVRILFDGTLGKHALKIAAGGDGYALDAAAAGGLYRDAAGDQAWSGILDSATARGAAVFHLAAPASIEVARRHGRVGAAELALRDGHLRLDELTWDDARVTTRGAFDGVPVMKLARLAGYESPLATDITLAGEWSLASTPRLNGRLELRRERGDVYTMGPAGVDPTAFAFDIRTLALEATVSDDALKGSAMLRSERAGNMDATFAVAAGGVAGRIATDTPIALKLDAELSSLAPLQRWLGTFAALSGRAHLALAGSGTLATPRFDGTFSGDSLRFDSPPLGVHLVDGRVRARLADNIVTLDEFSIAGGDGRFDAHGTLVRANAQGGASVIWRATDFRAVNRPDLRLVVEGEGTLALAQRQILLTGKLGVIDGRVDYRRPRGTVLGDDVVVIGRPRETTPERTGPVPLALDLDVDLGHRLEFEGEGLRTDLEGRVRVTTAADGTLLGRGTIRAVNGTYVAFGQTLTIDRGQLIFDGPLDNPALDIVALRKNLAVEAGVALTGTVRAPQMRLTSNPPVPDGERLAWLVTGQGAGHGSGADSAALSAASAMLLGAGGRPIGAQIAQRFGLDDVSVRGSSAVGTASGASPASGQIVAFGKRITDRLTIVYEVGLTIANNALRLEYTLSRTLALRAEAGIVSAFGIAYRRAFE